MVQCQSNYTDVQLVCERYYPATGIAYFFYDPIWSIGNKLWKWRSRRALARVHKLREQGRLLYSRDGQGWTKDYKYKPTGTVKTEQPISKSSNEVCDNLLAEMEARIEAEYVRKLGKTREQIDAELEAGRKEYLQGRSIDDVFQPASNQCTINGYCPVV